MHRPVLILLTLFGAAAIAQPQFPDAPPPPPRAKQPQAPVPDAETLEREHELEPQVTIIQEAPTRIEEYRVGGRLVYVRIEPAKGAPYFLFDTDGDGILDERSNSLDNPPLNQWILHQW